MPEWWSYSLSDFLLFSPRTYYRLFERHNLAMWPAQIFALGLGFVILALLRRRPAGHERLIAAILAGLWALVAWAFLWKRYATINWAVIHFLPLFALEFLLLIWIGVVRTQLTLGTRNRYRSVAGTTLLVVSIALYPAVAPVLGRGWRQAEVFGIAPDPTVIGTAGLLLLAERMRWSLLTVPLLWCVISGLTLWAMGSSEMLLPAAAAATVMTAAALHLGKPEGAEVRNRIQS